MSVVLPTIPQPVNQWVAIPLGAEQTLEIEVKRPTFADQVAALLAVDEVSHIRTRIQASVVNWRGVVTPEGADVPFSWSMLESLLTIYPQALRYIQAAVLDVWVTYPGDLEKNLPLPPVNGGTETTEEITSGTGSSSLPSSSSGGSDSVPSTVT